MESDSGVRVVTVTGPQTIRQAPQTHALLLAALQPPEDIELDCAGVTDADLSFVQLLIAARRSAEASGRRLVLATAPPERLQEVLRQGGFVGRGAAASPDPLRWGEEVP